MGHTNSTPNYNFPQFVGTDKPTFLGDINGAFLAIDSAIAGVAADADSAASVANTAASTAAGAVETANTAASTAASAASTATAAQSTANTAADTANNAQSTAVLAKSTADSAATDAATAITDSAQAVADAAEAKAAAVRGKVEVTSDGVKTYAQIYNEIFAACDFSKINVQSIMTLDSLVLQVEEIASNYAIFSGAYGTYINIKRNTVYFASNNSGVDTATTTASGTTFGVGVSQTVPAAGKKFALYY